MALRKVASSDCGFAAEKFLRDHRASFASFASNLSSLFLP
jgi:hypothetical protein